MLVPPLEALGIAQSVETSNSNSPNVALYHTLRCFASLICPMEWAYDALAMPARVGITTHIKGRFGCFVFDGLSEIS